MFGIKLVPIFTVRVIYKSGYTHDFDVTRFKIIGGSRYEWDAVDQDNQPVQLGADDVAAVWTVGIKRRLRRG